MAVPTTAVGTRPVAALDATDRARLLSGAHHDPHALLGAHPVPGGVVFRVLRPYAESVAVVVDGRRTELRGSGTASSRASCRSTRSPSTCCR